MIAVPQKSDAHSNSPVKALPATTDARSSETREQSSIPSTEQVSSVMDEKIMNDLKEFKSMVTALISQAEKESETNENAVQEL